MISEIKQAIIEKLLTIYPTGYRFYDEDIPQDLMKPAFVISAVGQDYRKGLGSRYNCRLSFELAYYSGDAAAGIKADCFRKQEELLRAFDDIGSFHVLNRNARITDNVLRIGFDIKYTEIRDEAFTPMQQTQINTNI